jgi:hypothetical protein
LTLLIALTDPKVSTTPSSNRFALSSMASQVFQKRSASDASGEIGHHRPVDVVGSRWRSRLMP